MLQFSSEVEQNIDDNNDFLRIDPKMSMILILWSSERLVVHPWLQPLIHQRVAWLQWSVSMVLALPKVSGSKEAPVLCVNDRSGLFL